jgi:glycosyltransferase involved in cell wall biosynthesis
VETILLSNIPHYHYLAQSLHAAGYLKRYVTSIALAEEDRVPSFLPVYWRRKLEGRRLRGVPSEKVRRLWSPELLQRGLPMLGMVSEARGSWMNNHLFDWMATRWIDRCRLLHFVSSVGLYCAQKAKSFGAAVICDVRQEHPSFQEQILREEGRRLGIDIAIPGQLDKKKVMEELSLADYLVVPSTYAKQTFVEQGFDGDRIFVLPYGADLEVFRLVGRPVPAFRLLYVGNVTFRKGIQYLLQAMRELRLPGAELLLIGPVDPAMRPFLKAYADVFRHLGSRPKIELARHYSEASVFVLPSLGDAFSLAVLEAMACGLPVVVTESCGVKEVLHHGTEGFVVPIRDIGALKQSILALYLDPGLRMEMGQAAARRAREVTWRRYQDSAVVLYARLEQKGALS